MIGVVDTVRQGLAPRQEWSYASPVVVAGVGELKVVSGVGIPTTGDVSNWIA